MDHFMSNSKLIGTQATYDKKQGRKVIAIPKGAFKVAKIFHNFKEDHPVK
jgi:hypothetical protein